MTNMPKDTEKFMKEYLWPLCNRLRQPLEDHPSFESDDWLFVSCLWCILGDGFALNYSAKKVVSLYHHLLQGAEELDWLLCLQPNT